MAGLFGSTTIPGNRITDFTAQTASVGNPIPFGYGRFPVDGNVIWTAGIPTEHVTKKKQGKGGVKTEEYTYTLSYAISFCAGPIFGFLTISRNGKIVYTTDPSASVDDKAFAAKWKQKATFYYGDRAQMPDSTIEAKEGAGKVSAFRDLCYIVVEDDDVTDGGGAVPQYEAVVIATPPEVYMTSEVYPLGVVEAVSYNASPGELWIHTQQYNYTLTDKVSYGAVPGNLNIHSITQFYTDTQKVSYGVVPGNMTITTVVKNYTTTPEKVSYGVSVGDLTIKTIVINYSNPAEKVSYSVTPGAMTITTH